MANFPTKNQINFNNYLATQKAFVGRKWLLSELESKLLKSDKGVLLTAEMGYGKSALVSYIACMDLLSPGYMIRERLVGLHFCQYKVLSTIDPVLFIMNLAGTLSEHVPKYNKIMTADKSAITYYENDRKRCFEDPMGCFDALVRYPLDEIKLDPSKDVWFIIIDGLDECIGSYGFRDIYELLAAQIGQLPSSIKFLLTSRNLETVVSDFSLLEHYNLDSNDPRNINDIKEMTQIAARRTLMFYRFIGMFSSNNVKIENVVEIAKGNFLVLLSVIEQMAKYPGDALNFPSVSLEKFFLDQMKRVFGNNGESFHKVRGIFEILCTSFKPLAENQLLNVAQIDSDPPSERYMYDIMQLLGRELGHFIVRRGHGISLIHESLINFLTNVSRSHLPFFVSKANGHLKFAKYLIVELEHPNTTFIHFDIIEIITHVVNSTHSKTISEFRNKISLLRQTFSFTNLEEPLLHYSVRQLNSYVGMGLLIDIVGKEQLNVRNKHQVTALFIGAAHGHTESVKSLLDSGADIGFRVKDPPKILNTPNPVLFCKENSFWGYSVLHISAQHGHIDTVKELLSRKQSLMYETNAIGLIPFQLAVEFGHVEIMRMFLLLNSSLSDQHSLYYASLRGHLEAVKLLYDYGIDHECPVCNETMYWLRTGDARKQSCDSRPIITLNFWFEYDTEIEDKEYVVEPRSSFVDDWRLITCESPMNAAVRKGFTDIVSFFLETENPSELFLCRTYDGGSPILIAVQYNRTDIFQVLLQNGANINERYSSQRFQDKNIKSNLNHFEYLAYGLNIDKAILRGMCSFQSILHGTCPYDNDNDVVYDANFLTCGDFIETYYFSEGATIGHILARFADSYMINKFDRFVKSWNDTDINDNTPLHYAAMFNNSVMVSYLLQTNQYKSVPVTKQLMTPFHVAALAKSYEAIYALGKGYGFISDHGDTKGYTVIQYLMQYKSEEEGSLSLRTYSEPLTPARVKNVVLFTLDRSFKSVYHRDNKGFTVFHFAGMNGHDYFIPAMKKRMDKSDFYDLLTSNSNDGQSALDLAFTAMSNMSLIGDASVQCFNNPYFLDAEKLSLQYCFSPFDLFIIEYLLVLQSGGTRSIDEQKLKTYMETAVQKSRIRVLFSMKIYFASTFKQIVEKYWKDLLERATEPLTTSLILPDTLIKCDVDYLESPLHIIVMEEKISYSKYFPFAESYLSSFNADFLNNCRDTSGFNILERSIIGDNTCIMNYLIGFGMSIEKDSVSLSETIYSILYASSFANDKTRNPVFTYSQRPQEQCIGTKYVTTNSRYSSYYGGSVQRLLLLYDDSKLYVCNADESLSLVHLVAIKGLTLSLRTLRRKYGRDILECKNKHGFTPLYFAKFFHQTGAEIYLLNTIGGQMNQPNQLAENVLLVKIFLGFVRHMPSYSFVWKCQYLNVHLTFKVSFSSIIHCMQKLHIEYIDLQNTLNPIVPFSIDEAINKVNKETNKLQDFLQSEKIPKISRFWRCVRMMNKTETLSNKCNKDVREILKWKRRKFYFVKDVLTKIKYRCRVVTKLQIQYSMISDCEFLFTKLPERLKHILCDRNDLYSRLYLSRKFSYLDKLFDSKDSLRKLLLNDMFIRNTMPWDPPTDGIENEHAPLDTSDHDHAFFEDIQKRYWN